jgi:hypothetical protein
MLSRVERAILRGPIGGAFRAPGSGASAHRFRGLVLPDGRNRLSLVDVGKAAGRPGAGRHRLRRALVRTMTIALLALLALIISSQGHVLT